MKLFNRILFISFAFSLSLTSCQKTDFLDNESSGQSIKEFSLLAPASNSTISINPALPNEKIVISWSPTASAVNLPVTYKLVAIRKTSANFDATNRVFEVPSDNAGKATTLTLTYKQLDDLLKATGFAALPAADLVWTIEADNGTTKVLSTDSRSLSIKRSANGATPFNILGPSTASAFVINPNSTTDSLKFNWTRSKPATGSPAISYTVRFYNGDDMTTPAFSLVSNSNGVDSFRAISYKDMSDTLAKYGLPSKVDLKWSVAATSGTWAQASDYTNDVKISRLIPYNYPYALNVTGNFQGWNPSAAPQVVSITNNGEYEGYIFFNDPAPKFKFVKGDNWGAGDFGTTGGNGIGSGGDISLPSSGHYRVKVNTNTMTWEYTKIENWGVIGSATPGGWGTDTDMTYNSTTGAWEVTLNLVAGYLKFRANDGWDINFGDSGNDGTLDYGGSDIPVASDGTYKDTLDLNYGGNWSYSIKKM